MTARLDYAARTSTAWAAGTLKNKGCILHSVEGGCWDIELPNGEWRTANDWRELCDVAHEAIAKAEG